MTFDVLRSTEPVERAAWMEAWAASPQRDPFAHPSYCELFADVSAVAVAVHCTCDAGEVLFPLILRDLSGEPWCARLEKDAVTPYGYGGPYWWGDDAGRTAAQFWPRYDEWAHDTHLVSEFVRLSLFGNWLLPYPGKVRFDRHNVVRELRSDMPTIWMDVRHKVRKNVNRANREGLQVVFDDSGDRLAGFAAIYEATMDRREAAPGYRWNRAFFERICHGLVGSYVFAHVLRGSQLVSTELILLSRDVMYSYLGGTDDAFYDCRPNDLLKWEAMVWGHQHGKHFYVLGGGHEPNDGIYQYKHAFAPNGTWDFSVGCRVHDSATYAALTRSRAALAAERGEVWQPRPDYFPEYRA